MLFLALLAVVAEIGVVAGLVLAAGRRVPGLDRLGRALAADLAPAALGLAAAVALVATVGSLYLSEVAHFVPCRLCWVQRAAMYPLGPVLAVAAWRGSGAVRRRVASGGAVVAGLGGLVSTYHLVLERFPSLESGACDPTNPCSLIWVRRFGYLTIPGMALSGFLLIVGLLLVARLGDRVSDRAGTRQASSRTGSGSSTTSPDASRSTR
ncbi:MAG: disulfide bond formation protein B [Acidimicrobiia bacterium]